MDSIRELTTPEYKIVPTFKKRMFFYPDKKVYEVWKHSTIEYWSDPSYGNGGGSWSPPTKRKEKIITFDTLMEADGFIRELKKLE